LGHYIRLARVDHWFKNVFMLPGSFLAMILADLSLRQALPPTIIGVLSVCFLASGNYVINEWLDAPYDRHHPTKRHRPSAIGVVRAPYVWLQYFGLAALGLLLAAQLTREFFVLAIVFLVMGWIYNIHPVRAKDRIFVDVLTESVNNPLRLLLGWTALVSEVMPPSSIILAYWMGGAFLMSVKRYAEYRSIADPQQAGLYRRSFVGYTELTLLLSSFFYALTSSFFLGIFLIKYRVEFLLTFPLFALLFVWYLAIGMRPDSTAQAPEGLYRERGFLMYAVFLCGAVIALFFVDIPWLQMLTEPIAF
jgi:4-hydroxybenzoate polyprenyltransferase